MNEERIRAAFAHRLGKPVIVLETEKVYHSETGNVIGTAAALGLHFEPHPVGPDDIVLGKWLDECGVLNTHHVPTATLAQIFGGIFSDKKPSLAEFQAACDANGTCRGYCRYAKKFQAEGVIK